MTNPPPDDPIAAPPPTVDLSEILRGPSLGSGMQLGGLGRALAADSRALMDEVSKRVRRLVDLPGDVYRTVVQVPDERAVRDHLQDEGADVLSVVVPVSRAIVTMRAVVPGGPLMQPVLLGKVFGVHDYVRDRQAALAAIPELPAALAEEAGGIIHFVRRHHDQIATATRALPQKDQLVRLGQVQFWEHVADEEWKATCAAVDAHYLAVAKHEERVKRDLALYRAAYALAYHTLATVDPVAGALAQIMPQGIAAYQRFATHRERFARIVGHLKDADFETEAPPAPPKSRPSAPASARHAPAQLGPALTAPEAPAAPAAAGLKSGGLRAPAVQRLPQDALHIPAAGGLAAYAPALGTIEAPPRTPPPRLARRLHLEDPGLGADPQLEAPPAPAGAVAQPLPPGPRAPSGPKMPAGAKMPQRPQLELEIDPPTAPNAPADVRAPVLQVELPTPTRPDSPDGLPRPLKLDFED